MKFGFVLNSVLNMCCMWCMCELIVIWLLICVFRYGVVDRWLVCMCVFSS